MKTLAVCGGNPLFKPEDFKSVWPVVGRAETNAAARVAASGNWWRDVPNSEVAQFEREYAAYHDARHCLAVSNGTVAITAALAALDLPPGAEVIVPSMTFIASASAVIMAGGVPVFADIDPATYQIAARSVEQHITRRTAGIVAVHYGGYPANLDMLRRVAKRHGLFLVEDCAHAQGSEWRGRKVGAIGDAGTFSFQQSKSLTSGEGGAVVTDRADVYEKAYAYHHIGRSLGADRYEHTIVGPNYRLTEFQGAILRTQLRKLQRQTETKMRNVAALFERLRDIPGLTPLKPDKRITQRGYYFVVIRYREGRMKDVPRDVFLRAVRAEGMPVHAAYRHPVYRVPVFAARKVGRMDYSKVRLPAVEHASDHEQLAIPHQYFMYRENVARFAAIFAKVTGQLDALRED